jgi:pilus assembly protein Flp/PilA
VDNPIGNFLSNDSAVTAIEYALLASLIAVAIIGSVSFAGAHLFDLWNYVKDQVILGTS